MYFNIVLILVAVVSVVVALFLAAELHKAVKKIKRGDFWTFYSGVSGVHCGDCIDNRSVVAYFPPAIFLCLGVCAGVILHMISPLSVRIGYLIIFTTIFGMTLCYLNAIIYCQRYMHVHKIKDEGNYIGGITSVSLSAFSLIFLVFFLLLK